MNNKPMQGLTPEQWEEFKRFVKGRVGDMFDDIDVEEEEEEE